MTNPVQKASSFFESIAVICLAVIMVILSFFMAKRAYIAIEAKQFGTADDFVGMMLNTAGCPVKLSHAMYIYIVIACVCLVLSCVSCFGTKTQNSIVIIVFTILIFVFGLALYIVSFFLKYAVDNFGQQVNNLLSPICANMPPVKEALDCPARRLLEPTWQADVSAAKGESFAWRFLQRMLLTTALTSTTAGFTPPLNSSLPLYQTHRGMSGTGFRIAQESVISLEGHVQRSTNFLSSGSTKAPREVLLPFTFGSSPIDGRRLENDMVVMSDKAAAETAMDKAVTQYSVTDLPSISDKAEEKAPAKGAGKDKPSADKEDSSGAGKDKPSADKEDSSGAAKKAGKTLKMLCDTVGSSVSFCIEKCDFLNDLCTPKDDPDYDPDFPSGLFTNGLGFASAVFGLGVTVASVMMCVCCCSCCLSYELMREKSIIEFCDFCHCAPKIQAGYEKIAGSDS